MSRLRSRFLILLVASSAGVISLLTSGCGTEVTPAPQASKLAFTVQPSNVAAGASLTGLFDPGVVVAIQDASGNLITTATNNVTIAIGTNPASGTLSGTKTVAAVAGVATFSNLSIDKAGTGYTLTASSTGLTMATSAAFNITAGAAAKLAFTVQPSNVAPGGSITPAVQVTIQDASGNTVTTATNDVTIAIGTDPSGGTLSGTLTVAAVAGVATFSDLSIDNTGTGYTLTASSTGLTAATSAAFNITTAAACNLNGQYAFNFRGFDSDFDFKHDVQMAGSFTVASDGTVTSGVEDINRFSGVAQNVAITGGSAAAGAGQPGTLILTTALGSTTYHYTTNSTCQQGNFIEFDDTDGTGTRGGGGFSIQNPATFTPADVAGDKVIGLQGFLNGQRAVAVGRFTMSSIDGSLSNGQMDFTTHLEASGGVTAAGASPLTLTGGFGLPDPTTGRGAATLTVSSGNFFAGGTYNFNYYVAALSNLYLVQTDPRSSTVPELGGVVVPQTGIGTFSNSSLNGNIIYSAIGVDATQTVNNSITLTNTAVTVGRLVADGAGNLASTSTLDQKVGGNADTVNSNTFNGTYSVAGDGLGRTTLTFNLSNPLVEVGYLVNTNNAFIIDAPPTTGAGGSFTEVNVNYGSVVPQSGAPFGATPLSGSFRAFAGSRTPISEHEVGTATFDISGNFSWTTDISDPDASVLLSSQTSSGTYSVDSDGRVTIVLPSPADQTLVLWISGFSPPDFVSLSGILSVNSFDDPVSLSLVQQ